MAAFEVTPFIERLVRLAGEGAHSAACSLYLLDEAKKRLHPSVVIGLPDAYVKACGPVAVGTQCCGRAVEHKRPWLVTDMLTDPLFADARKAAQDSPIRAAFSVPVIAANGEVLGSLACHYKKPYTASENDIERNEIFAKLIAYALTEEEHHPHVETAVAAD
jgi:GAF domain-containing protein